MKTTASILCCLLMVGCGSAQKKKDSEAATYNLELGTAYLSRGQWQNASHFLQQALQHNPRDGRVYNMLGLLHMELGEAKQADRRFRQALRYAPDDAAALNNYGTLLCQQQQYKRAHKFLLKAADTRLYEKRHHAYTNAARCLIEDQQLQAAELPLQQALGLEKDFGPALLLQARLRYLQKRYTQAYLTLQRYERHAQPSAESLLLGSQLAQRTGDNNGLRYYSGQLLQRFPNSEQARYLRQANQP